MSMTVIIVGVVCAGLFALVGPIGIILAGILFLLGGVKANKDD